MKRLLGERVEYGRVYRDWVHTGDDGKPRYTTEIKQDVSPIIKATRINTELNRGSKDFRLKAEIPVTMIEDAARTSGKLWGVSTMEAYREITGNKSSRGKKVLKTLTEGRDYRKLQAKAYR